MPQHSIWHGFYQNIRLSIASTVYTLYRNIHINLNESPSSSFSTCYLLAVSVLIHSSVTGKKVVIVFAIECFFFSIRERMFSRNAMHTYLLPIFINDIDRVTCLLAYRWKLDAEAYGIQIFEARHKLTHTHSCISEIKVKQRSANELIWTEMLSCTGRKFSGIENNTAS